MLAEVRAGLVELLLALGDDELILGHRDSEWCGHAPILEEDIAFANLALDEIGHAMLWYGVLALVVGEDPDEYPDRLVYGRRPHAYRCTRLVALPRGDWAFAILRQYLFDEAEAVRLAWLAESGYRPLADVAAKIRVEEGYHLRHTRAWVRRLGLGTEESQRRLQTALDEVWPYALQIFVPLAGERELIEAAVLGETAGLRAQWEERVRPFLRESGVRVPEGGEPVAADRRGQGPDLVGILAELQSVPRQFGPARW